MPKDARASYGASRACDACHRMKIRCVDRANPPCRRCKTMDLECTFTLEATTSSYRIKSNQDRVAHLEHQMDQVQTSMRNMEDMIRVLVDSSAKVSTAASSVASLTNTTLPTTLDEWVSSTSNAVVPVPDAAAPPPRADSSEEDDDYLVDAANGASMKQIIYHDEEERLRRQESLSSPGTGTGPSPNERRESDTMRAMRLARREKNNPIPTQRGDLLQDFADPVLLGYLTEQEGRHLFDLYFQGAHAFLPVFDAEKDTWDSLRARSSFCLTAILLAGLIASAGDNGISESGSALREKLLAHAEKIALATVFSPVASIEAIQAMAVILTNWGDTSWRPGNHLLSLALDMDLHMCLPHLAKNGMGRSKTGQELERERALVAGTRIWLATSKTHTEMCFNYGRPVLCPADQLAKHGRAFLEHPLSTREDSRNVVICEAHAMREPVHAAQWQGVHGEPLNLLIDAAMVKLALWEQYWFDYYARQGFSDDNFFVTELITVKHYTILQLNVALLQGIKTQRDVRDMPAERRHGLAEAVRAAAALVARAVRGPERAKLRHGNRNSRLGLAHAARSLIRMASLLPEAINLREAAKDVELLADQLARFPDFHFAQFLHHVVVEARRKKQLPPGSVATSPRAGAPALPDATFDFTVADDMFASEDWMTILAGGVTVDQLQPVEAVPAFQFFALEQPRFGQVSGPSPTSEDYDGGLFGLGSGRTAWLPSQ
ncbi:uncharacterized protein LOC62_01G001684 [Vanrija pseudolonga]|uniref:Zn(2)-C6 fungal-type domain-containing protein n=1 Tax=Vanrija pseudolonga TaxID=143232 RepID=A0AAF1BJA7_9TREE|nr:hypothetical protein LOC62_01G001684 [Vanrija pseudolonga]